MNTITETYINALLADASYVRLREYDENTKTILPGLLSTVDQKAAIAARLTQPQADFITANFTVLNQELSPTGGFDAVVWQGKAGSAYAGKTYVSMRGTQEGRDFKDDIPLAFEGLPFNQLASMVNWWLRETAPSGTSVKQIKIITSLFPNPTVFVADNNAIATGGLFATGVTRVDSVNGHSLGGYLATAFTRLFGNSLSVEHTTTFNSAGFRTAANSDIETAFVQIQSLIGAQKGRSSFNNDTQQDNFYAENGLNLTTNAAMGVTGFTQYGKRTALYQEFSSSQVPNHYMYKQTDLLALGAALIVSRSFRGSIRCLVI